MPISNNKRTSGRNIIAAVYFTRLHWIHFRRSS